MFATVNALNRRVTNRWVDDAVKAITDTVTNNESCGFNLKYSKSDRTLQAACGFKLNIICLSTSYVCE